MSFLGPENPLVTGLSRAEIGVGRTFICPAPAKANILSKAGHMPLVDRLEKNQECTFIAVLLKIT